MCGGKEGVRGRWQEEKGRRHGEISNEEKKLNKNFETLSVSSK